jgi:hypothetical protein
MLRRGILFTLCGAVFTIFFLVSAASLAADKPIWAKKGVTFSVGCSGPFKGCRAFRVPSPDGKNAVEITYQATPDYPDIEVASLRVTKLGRNIGDVGPVASVQDELTWSPDSKAFFINGNNNANGWDLVAVHLLDDPGLGPGDITREVEQDMVRSFPPCQAKDPRDDCAALAAKPDDYIGVVGLDWIGNSSRIVVMAEVPCSSSMGGIMCQVLGYEIDVPSGKILRRMEAKEFARRWQRSMAWKFHIPDPPEYESKTPPKS